MKSKIFTNGSNNDPRKIIIIINNEFAEFFHNEYYNKDIEWLEEQKENGNIDEDSKYNNGFYWIEKDDWNFRQQEWINHLSKKNWVTIDMLDYLQDNLSIKK